MNKYKEEAVKVLLQNMISERSGWKRYIFGRWNISHEPLRNDAKTILDWLNKKDE